jgi:nitrite reductase/ring-hydroxylating ferredoxin subunit
LAKTQQNSSDIVNMVRMWQITYLLSSFATFRPFYMPRIKLISVLLTLLCGLMLPACDENQQGPIPYVPVNIYLSLNEPSNANLLPIGGWVYVSGGSKGIIVYHSSIDEYYAFDRNCTFEAYGSCVTLNVVQADQATEDPCCGSKFSLNGGTVLNGPATMGMVQYQTDLSGQVLHIYN